MDKVTEQADGFGFFGAIYFAFMFDTTVDSDFMGQRTRVQNMSLAQPQTIGVILSVGLLLAGRVPSVVTMREWPATSVAIRYSLAVR